MRNRMRIFLGPYNIGGLYEYKKGLDRLGAEANVILYKKAQHNKPSDMVLPINEKNLLLRPFWEFNYLPSFIRDFDIFHFFFGRSLITFHLDVPFLKLAGKKIVMSFLGSDIRCSTPVLEGIRDRRDCNYCKYPCNLSRKKKRVKYWACNADAIIAGVDNPQLLDYYLIPYHVIPLPCDIEYWKPFKSTFYTKEKDEVLIVHAPSNMRAKGTPIIAEVIQKLKIKYKINFKVLYNIPNSVVREWLNVADIVIDQFGTGWHGTLSLESMALGKPTLCYINEEYKRRYPQYSKLPIVNIIPTNIYKVLESLTNDAPLRKRIGVASRKYVEKVHDSRIVCKNLLNIYKSLI